LHQLERLLFFCGLRLLDRFLLLGGRRVLCAAVTSIPPKMAIIASGAAPDFYA
jgi:hypothetical protein